MPFLKVVTISFVCLLLVSSCEEEVEVDTTTCSTKATVRDLTGLDGCGFIFELADGTRLEPQRMFYCGTPPLPKEVTEDLLFNFDFVDGKKVTIGYERCTDCVSVCMVGQMVKITCLSEDSGISGED